RKLLIIYFVLYSFFLIFSLSYIFSAPANNAWEQIADHVKKNINEKEMILFAPAHLLAPFWYYYKYEDKLALKEIGDGDCGQFYMADGKWQMEFNDNANLIKGLCFEEIDEMLRKFKPFADNHKGVWLVISPWIGKQNMERIIDMFHRYYTVEWSGKFPWNAVCGYHLIRRE
ncbi:MAG: hypothetical protein L6416_08450, partial [Candidatus Omnitrophica bacterium]|nr:hypothetical protein [Candidatus Omnitrophota bacterium]